MSIEIIFLDFHLVSSIWTSCSTPHTRLPFRYSCTLDHAHPSHAQLYVLRYILINLCKYFLLFIARYIIIPILVFALAAGCCCRWAAGLFFDVVDPIRKLPLLQMVLNFYNIDSGGRAREDEYHECVRGVRTKDVQTPLLQSIVWFWCFYYHCIRNESNSRTFLYIFIQLGIDFWFRHIVGERMCFFVLSLFIVVDLIFIVPFFSRRANEKFIFQIFIRKRFFSSFFVIHLLLFWFSTMEMSTIVEKDNHFWSAWYVCHPVIVIATQIGFQQLFIIIVLRWMNWRWVIQLLSVSSRYSLCGDCV